MAQHLAAWFESLDSAALGRITTVQDDVLTPTGTDRFLVPEGYNYIQHAFGSGLNLAQARIVTPSLERAKSDLDILPINEGADLPDIANPAVWIPPRFISLDVSESIEVQAAEDGAGATTMQVFVALGESENAPMPAGGIRSIRLTGTTTLVADGWTSVTLTPESTLEAGRYTMVHFSAHSVSGIAARWLPQGGGFRPGLMAFNGASPLHFQYNDRNWHKLGWYSMLNFTHVTLPQIQFFASAADTAQVVQMYAIRTGDL